MMENLFIYTGLVFWYIILLMLGISVIYILYILLYDVFIKKTQEYGILISYNELTKNYKKNLMDEQYKEFTRALRILINKYQIISKK